MEPRRRPAATLVLLVLAFTAFPATLLLWWMGTLPGHHAPEIGREIFGNVPGAVQAAFYVGMGSFLALSLYLFSERARSWARGTVESRAGRWGERFKNMMSGLAMRTLLRDRASGLMHALIYYGFVLLFLGTVTLEIDHLLPAGLKFLNGTFYEFYSAILDAAALALIVGVVWAVIRRYGQAPWRLRSKTKAEDAWILTVLGLIGLTGVFTEAARIAVDGRPDFEVWSFLGYPLSSLFPAADAAGWHQFFWIFHVVTFVWFLVILPTTKLRHMLTSPANMFLAPMERPKGAMKALPNLMEATDIESIGASVITDLTWKQIFEADACTVCGRCTSVCPANTTGKPLDPREMVLKVGEVAASTAPSRIATPVSLDAEITIDAGSLFDRVTPEELWSCTTCRACDEICPVNIEILDKILDMRRYKTLMEADFPTELGKAFVALENQGNPWGLSQQNRMDWAKDLDFEVKVLGDGVESADYLYWVGCAGSFDDRNVEVTKATARLLHEAGIDFAILGPKESCTGDPARRSGNEYLYQQLALSNIETLNDLGVRKVITQCPHCFNSLANDYPQLGGDYEVVHHSQLLMELVGSGSLDTAAATGAKPQITFHDPCYLGRHNDVYAAPREVVSASGASLIEMERNGANAMCCGAGGARFWMEEHTGKKVNVERAEQALATGAEEVAVGCPYCYVMIDDGIKELGADVKVRDISMILADSVFKSREL